MREPRITGAVRGKKVISTIPDPTAPRAPDLVDRDFVAAAPNRCWAADFTHVATFSGVVYVAFVVDTFSRRIVGWSASTTQQTRLVLDALDMGLWQRDRDQYPPLLGELVHQSDAGSQYTSFTLAEHLEKACIAASIGWFSSSLPPARRTPTGEIGGCRTPGDVRSSVRCWAASRGTTTAAVR
ncbi:DDE-type integrase/transposase/recombinase [Streptomyces sp. PA03-1a]|nr:DDE-type integrase/transposase/recombinase [Streptomyces sp. PA03-1a]